MSQPGIVVVGGSYAGLYAAAAARTSGHTGPVTLVGNEAHLPYQRPPLSKECLRGGVDATQLLLRPAAFFETASIGLRTGTTAVAIDRPARQLMLDTGERLTYDKLILATGCRPRLLAVPGADAVGVHYLRTMDDAVAIAQRVGGVRSVAVIGGGFIGLEIAASLRRMGKDVAVIEALPRLLTRALSPEMAAYVAGWHEREGVRLLFQTQVTRCRVNAGRVDAVELADGSLVPADLVIVGIGVLPNQELAESAGLACHNGVAVDAFCRTSDPDILAAGDCTNHPNAYAGGAMRLECVQNAVDQGRIAGANAAGSNTEYAAPPWFWSDQYEVKLQGVGISTGYDRTVIRGSMADNAFSSFYFRGDALLAVESVNKPAEHMLSRKLLATKARLTDAQVADTGYDLKRALAR